MVDNVGKPGYSRTGLMNVRIERVLWRFFRCMVVLVEQLPVNVHQTRAEGSQGLRGVDGLSGLPLRAWDDLGNSRIL